MKTRYHFTIIVLSLVILIPVNLVFATESSQNNMSDTSSAINPDSAKKINLWTYTPPSFPGPLAISSNGSLVIVGTRQDDQHGSIYALDNNGVVTWSHDLPGFVRSVHMSPDGKFIEARTIQILNNGGRDYGYYAWDANPAMYVFDNAGQTIYSNIGLLPNWRMISSSGDGSLVASSTGNGILYSDKSGKALWGYDTKGNVTSVSVSPNGLFVSTCTGNDLLSFDKQGELLWDSRINGTSVCPAISSSDFGYVLAGSALSSETGDLYFFDNHGNQVWKHTDSYVNPHPITSKDNQYEVETVGESPSGFGLDVSFNKLEYSTIPEFPFAIPVLLISIVSVIVFYRIKFSK